jgi:hypothetical protein
LQEKTLSWGGAAEAAVNVVNVIKVYGDGDSRGMACAKSQIDF